MTPIPFKEQTLVIAEHQRQYIPIPAHLDLTCVQFTVTCCWRLSWRERLAVLTTGRLWHQVQTYGQPFQPTQLMTGKPAMRTPPKESN